MEEMEGERRITFQKEYNYKTILKGVKKLQKYPWTTYTAPLREWLA